jgi:hypothetical protein
MRFSPHQGAAEFARWAVHARSFSSRTLFGAVKNTRESTPNFWSEPCFE